MKKRVLTLLLAVIMALSIVTTAAAANNTTDYNSYSTPGSSDYAYWSGSKVVRASGTTVSEVKWMQAALNYCIKNKGLNASYLDVDGSFGPASQTATKAFQRKYGLDVDGSFGPSTISKMKEVLKPATATPTPTPAPSTPKPANNTTDYNSFSTPGSSDYAYWDGSQVVRNSGTTTSEVKWMQAALNYCIKNKGLNASYLDVDGSFGPASQTATKAFQKKYGLSVDGSFGPSTIAKMKEALGLTTAPAPSTPKPTPTPTPKPTPTPTPVPERPTYNTDYTSFSTPGRSDYAYWSGSQAVRSSDTSVSEVKWMQAALNYCIRYRGLSALYLDVDGSFGPASQSATETFQRAYGLSVDGSFGPGTIQKMREVLGLPVSASVSGSYDPLAAIQYAEAHWDDGNDKKVQCAEFVSDSLEAGGCTAYSTRCTDLIWLLKNGGWGTESRLKVDGNGWIPLSQNEGKVAVGDPIFCYCSHEDRNYVHVFLCSGQDAAGYLTGYAHHDPLNGRIKARACGYCGNPLSAVYVFHMNGSAALTQVPAPETQEPEVSVSYDTGYNSYSVPDDSDYAYWNGNKSVLASGTVTNEVRWMQATLNYCIQNKGLNASYLEVDGSFGPASKSATKAFQSQNGLSADGSFGPATINKMKSVLGIQSAEPAVTSGASKITTAQIQAVLNQYGYTTGKYWTYPSSGSANRDYTASNRPGRQYSYRYNGVECYGFANFVMHKVTGTTVNPNNGNHDGWTYLKPSQVTDLRVGDIVRIGKNNSNGHSGVVLTVSKNGKCTFAECWGGVNNKLNIGKTLTSSHFGTHSSLSTMKKQGVLLYVYRYTG